MFWWCRNKTCFTVIIIYFSGPLKEAANVLMILITVNDVYCHWALDSSLDKMSLSIVFFFLLVCRLIIFLQFKARDMEEGQKQTPVVSAEKKED